MSLHHPQHSSSLGSLPSIEASRFGRVSVLVVLGLLLLRYVIPGFVVHAQADPVSWSEPVRLTTEGKLTGSLFYTSSQITTDKYGYVHIFWRELSEPSAIMYARTNGVGPVQIRDIIATETAHPVSAFVDESDNLQLTIVERNQDFYLKTVPLSQSDNVTAWIESPAIVVPGAVYQGATGVWYALHKIMDAGYISFSEDAGVTWSDEIQIVTAAQPGEYAQFDLAEDRYGRLHLAWTSQEVGDRLGSGYFLEYIYSDDRGQTWTAPVVLDTKDERYQGDYGIISVSLTLDSSDHLHLIWNGAPAGQRHYRHSEDRGLSWSPDQQLWPDHRGITGGHKLAEDSTGTMHLMTGSLGGGSFHAFLTDNVWSLPSEIDPSIGDAQGHQIMITAGNRLHVIWGNVMETGDVWYASGLAPAPAVSVPAYPTPSPVQSISVPNQPVLSSTPTMVSAQMSEPDFPVQPRQELAEGLLGSPTTIVFGSTLLSLLLVGVVVGVNLAKKRHR